MGIYLALAILLLFFSLIYDCLNNVHLPVFFRARKNYSERFCYGVCCIFMVCIVAFRAPFWSDFKGYNAVFYGVKYQSFKEILINKVALTNGGEVGFSLLVKLISYFTDEPVVCFAVLAFFTYLPIFYVVGKESKAPFFSLLIIYVAGFFWASFNVIRSCLAYGLATLLFYYLREGKLIKYMLCTLLLTTIHSSAVLFAPLYFLLRGKCFDRKHLLLSLCGIFVFYISFDLLFFVLDRILLNSFYSTKYYGNGMIAGAFGLIVPAAAVIILLVVVYPYCNQEAQSERILFNGTVVWCVFKVAILIMRLISRFSDMLFLFPALYIPEMLMKIRSPKKECEMIQSSTIFILVQLFFILYLVYGLKQSPFNPYQTFLR